MAWKAKKRLYLAMLSDPERQLTKQEMAQELGVCTTTLRNWEREEGICRTHTPKKKIQTESEWATLKSVLYNKALEGDVAAAKLLLQMRGMNLESEAGKGISLEEALALITEYLKSSQTALTKTDSEN